MSEVRYRRRLSRLRVEDEFMQFTGALLESHLPLPDQLRMILARDDLEMSHQAVRLIHVLKIRELAPDLIHLFKTVDALEGRSLKDASLLALIRLRHEEIHPFLLAVIQEPGDNSYRITAAMILKIGGTIRPELVIPFLRMAEDPTELTEIRSLAIHGLLRHGGVCVVSLLVPLLQDQSGEVRSRALGAFERHGDAVFASAIKPLINDDYQKNGMVSNGTRAHKLLRKWASEETNHEKPL